MQVKFWFFLNYLITTVPTYLLRIRYFKSQDDFESIKNDFESFKIKSCAIDWIPKTQTLILIHLELKSNMYICTHSKKSYHFIGCAMQLFRFIVSSIPTRSYCVSSYRIQNSFAKTSFQKYDSYGFAWILTVIVK